MYDDIPVDVTTDEEAALDVIWQEGDDLFNFRANRDGGVDISLDERGMKALLFDNLDEILEVSAATLQCQKCGSEHPLFMLGTEGQPFICDACSEPTHEVRLSGESPMNDAGRLLKAISEALVPHGVVLEWAVDSRAGVQSPKVQLNLKGARK